MKKIDFGQLSQTLANVGVLLGIVFLALEIRQNQNVVEEQNTLTRLTVRDTQYENYSRFRHLLLANPELQEILIKGSTGQNLTETEKARYRTMCNERLYMNLTAFTRAEALGFPGGLKAGVRPTAREIRGATAFKECWEDASESFRTDGYDSFVDEVERALAGP